MKRRAHFLVTCLTLGSALSLCAQHDWTITNPYPAAEQLESLAADADTFLLAGDNGLILTSADGLSWTRQQPGTRERFPYAANLDDLWFAYGYSGALFTSADALTWTQRTNGAGAGPLAYGNNRFVAITSTYSNVIRSSPDGVTWTEITLNTNGNYRGLYALCFAADRFWVAAYNTNLAGQLWSSPDGITWTAQTELPPDLPTNTGLARCIGTPTRLIALYHNNTVGYLAYTRDAGGTWARLTTPAYISDLNFVNGQYLLRSNLTTYASPDATTWTELPHFPPGIDFSRLVVRGGIWLALDRNRQLLRSIDGDNWTVLSRRWQRTGTGLAFVNGHFLTANGLRSTDGRTWTNDGFNPLNADSSDSASLFWISPVNGRAITVVSRTGTGYYRQEFWLTEDGETGQRVASFDLASGPGRIDYAAGVYATIVNQGGQYQVARSTDALTWTTTPSADLPHPISALIGSDGTAFYGLGVDSLVYRSVDALTWTLDLDPQGKPLPNHITATPDGLFAPAGSGYYRRTAADGWLYVDGGSWDNALFNGDRVVASGRVGDRPALFTTAADGTTSARLMATLTSYPRTADFATGNGVTVAAIDDLLAVAPNHENIVVQHALNLRTDGVVDEPVTLSVQATSRDGQPLHYQWSASGVDISGATFPTYTVSYAADASAPASLGVRITDGNMTVTSETRLSVYAQPGPVFALSGTGIAANYSFRDFDRYQVTLSAPVVSPGTPLYTWRRNGALIPNANGSSLTYEVRAQATGDIYTVTVTNARGSVTSGNHVETGPLPTIVSDDFTLYNYPTLGHGDLRLSIWVNYLQTIQWRRNGVAIPGATSAVYRDEDLQPDETGYYDAVVTSPFGTTTSAPRFVTTTQGRLANLSVRAWTGHGDAAIVPGVVLAGDHGGIHPVVRAVGPGLLDYGVTDPVRDPTLTVIDGDGTVRATNQQWGKFDYDLIPWFNLLGAFPLTFDSLDASVQVWNLTRTRETSRFTAPVSTPADDEGEILVEVYSSGGALTERLINLSCRAEVAPNKPFIAGFVVSGTGPVKLLLRGIGPALSDFGVSGAMDNPRLILRDSTGHEIGNNDSWWQAANLADIEASRATVGAFPLPAQSNDAAMFVTLEPGLYTAEIEGVVGSSGIAMVELYEVP